MNATEFLRLDHVRVRGMAQAYEGSARTSPPGRAEPSKWRTANDLAIAASFWAAIDVRRATKLFAEASRLYLDAAFDHEGERENATIAATAWLMKGTVLALCSGQTNDLVERASYWLREIDEVASTEELFTKMTAASYLEVVKPNLGFGRIAAGYRERANSLPAHVAGRLGWSLRAYSEISGALANIHADPAKETTDRTKLQIALVSLCDRINETVRSAQASEYHWQHLYSQLLPVEPDALVLCVAYHAAYEKLEPSSHGRLRLFNEISGASRGYFEVAHEIRVETGEDLPPRERKRTR